WPSIRIAWTRSRSGPSRLPRSRWAPERSASEEAALGPSVGVEVVRDVAHVVVDPELTHAGGGDFPELGLHVTQVVFGRRGAVKAPQDNRGLADVALGDPADLVLVVPGRDPRRPAQIATPDANESIARGRPRLRISISGHTSSARQAYEIRPGGRR